MEITINVTKLSHEELVNLLSTATYGNNQAIGIQPAKEYKEFQLKAQSKEDYWATILEQGGELEVADFYDDSETRDKANYYGKQGTNWVSTSWNMYRSELRDVFGRIHLISKFGAFEFGAPTYKINMKTLLAGINANPDSARYIQELFIDGDGDMYTAYNLMQIIIFGEVIYG